jgi:hypothetical protein
MAVRSLLRRFDLQILGKREMMHEMLFYLELDIHVDSMGKRCQ